MSAHVENDPDFNEITPKPGPRRRFTLGRLLLVVAVIALLIAFFIPATRRGSMPAVRRAQCSYNLKQIAMALNHYEQAHDALPPAYTVDANGRPLHSWRTLILPYLEEESLYESIDLSKPWDDPANAPALAACPWVFRCPASGDGTNKTTYLANVGPDGFLAPGRSRRMEEITDGLSKTLAVIEVSEDDAVPWMAPLDADPALVMKLDPESKLHHPGGMNAAFADGYVSFLKANLPAPIRRAILSISGNDDPATMDW